jgi:protein TIF31
MKEQSLDRAFELYSQAISVLLQITGPMEREVATYISQIAAI